MALSREDVAGIADYARIALTDAELDEMTAYMNDAVALLEPIRQYDLDGVEPTPSETSPTSWALTLRTTRAPCPSTSRSQTPAPPATATSACRPSSAPREETANGKP